MGCCPSNTFDQSASVPPLQANSLTSNYFNNTNPCSTDNPPPYTPQPLYGHKSISLPQSETVIPFRGWGDRPATVWSANTPPLREQQQLQTQVQFLQHFISMLQQESTPLGPVESLGDIEELEQLPPLNHNSITSQIHAPSFPLSPLLPSFPSPVLPTHTYTEVTPMRLPPIALDTTPEHEGGCEPEEDQCAHSQRTHSRKKRRKKRRRRATVTPTLLSTEYPTLTLQRPFTSPNLTATLASPLSSNQTFF